MKNFPSEAVLFAITFIPAFSSLTNLSFFSQAPLLEPPFFLIIEKPVTIGSYIRTIFKIRVQVLGQQRYADLVINAPYKRLRDSQNIMNLSASSAARPLVCDLPSIRTIASSICFVLYSGGKNFLTTI